ncbi:hypothetical protein FOZ60_000182 [Perkinsus olseni]|uniref:Transmembrane protein n=1 Tax=Perkinsus olseni TaxID=32597 RepID=A0A7J6PKJ0_PEROL|nr:hypothetical protein FOZ60_000182 [Perkinsus olseni]
MEVVTATEVELPDFLLAQNTAVSQPVEFADSSLYLRGVPMSTVAKKRHLFKDSNGGEDTYALSQSVDHLDAFVSHSWSANPPLKHVALVASQYCFLGYIVANAVVVSLGAGLCFALSDRTAYLIAFGTSVISFPLALFYGQTKFAFIISLAEVVAIVALSVLDIVGADAAVKTPYYACMLGCSLLLTCFLGVFVVYEYLPHRLALHRQASKFTVEGGECLLEEDKLVIRDLIKNWYGSLEAFEEYVRNHKEYITGRRRPWTVSYLTLAIISFPIELACVGRFVTICCTASTLGIPWWKTLRCFLSTLILLTCRMPLLVFAAYACFEHRRRPRWVEAVSMVFFAAIYELLALLAGGTILFDTALMSVIPEPYAWLTMVIPLLALVSTCLLYRSRPLLIQLQ